jgi:FAD/FMN-containing dehydrogenase
MNAPDANAMRELLERCTRLLGAQGVLTGEAMGERIAGLFHDEPVRAGAILRPRTTAEVSGVMRLCHAAGQVVVAHGGLTGLVEGTVARPSDVVLSLERMRAIEECDPLGRTMTAQAGAPLQLLQEEAERHGLMVPLDLGARGSCTIGGNVSTNAGGNRVIRYGMTREMVLGLEAVLADGTVLSSLNRMIKNNAGYDLKHLFIGAEGTLGIVTRVVLRLREAPASQNTALLAIERFDQVLRFLKFADRALGGSLSAFEVMWREFYELTTTEPARSRPPLPQHYPYYVLMEAIGADELRDAERFEAVLAQAFEEGLLADATIAKSRAESRAIWGIRDDVEQLARYGATFNFDVSLELKYMEAYVQGVRQTIASTWPGSHCFTFGHLGDGNLHLAIQVGDASREARSRVEQIVYQPLAPIRGSVSAEHGIGLEKKSYLPLCRSAEEIALMRTLKRALDPKGILNPGKIFDSAGQIAVPNCVTNL